MYSVSNLHGRPLKNNHPFGIYENIKLGLKKLHTSMPNRTPWCFHKLRPLCQLHQKNNKWYHCDDKHITETN